MCGVTGGKEKLSGRNRHGNRIMEIPLELETHAVGFPRDENNVVGLPWG